MYYIAFCVAISWLCQDNLGEHGCVCVVVAFCNKSHKYFAVFFRDDLNVFWADWEEGVFGHHEVAPDGLWVDF